MTNTTITVQLDRCGFCGARKGQVCREFGSQTTTHPDLFIEELDGVTAPTVRQAREWEWQQAEAEAEIAAEVGYERHLETNDQYRWEVEEDERRAAALSLAFDAWQDSIWCPR